MNVEGTTRPRLTGWLFRPARMTGEPGGIPFWAGRGFWMALGCIVAVAFLTRIVLVAYGLPLLLYEDEPIYYDHALGFGLGRWDIGYFKKPSFFLYFYGALYAFAYLYTPWMHWADYVAAFWRDPTYVATIGRTVSVLFAAGTVGLTGWLGRRCFSAPVGLAAALWLAGNLTHLRISPIVISDIPSLFFMVLTACFALRISETGRWRDYLACAAAAALTISFKYNVFSAAFLFAGHVTSLWRQAEPGKDWSRFALNALKDRRLWLSLALVGALFLLLNPLALLDFSTFQAHLAFEKRHMLFRSAESAAPTWQPMASAREIGLKILPRSLGWPLYLLGIGGFVAGLFRFWRPALVLGSFPLVFLLVVLQFRLINAKYLLPLTPFWLIFAAFFLWTACCWVQTRLQSGGMDAHTARRAGGALFCLLTLAMAVPAWWETLDYVRIQRESDTRNEAFQAIRVRAREGDRFFLEPDTLTLDNRVLRSSLIVADFRRGAFFRLDAKEPEGMSGISLAEIRPRYALINLGKAKRSRDARGEVFYRMPYAPAYYRELAANYRPEALFAPGRVRLSPQAMARTLREKGFGGLYADIRAHQSRRVRPGPFLLLLKREALPPAAERF